MFRYHVSFVLTFLYGTFALQAQVDTKSSLFLELKEQDSIFFERGFNQCDMDYFVGHITKDLKFYHDKGGFQDRNAFLKNTKKYICSNPDKKPIRTVDSESLEVYPMYNNGVLYGVIQKGTHHFYIRENGILGPITNTAKFTNLWLRKGNLWKMDTSLSYDHQDMQGVTSQQVNELEKMLVDNQVPALGMAIIENGNLTKVAVYGTLDKENKAPLNTIFKVASLTKPIVAITTLKLIDMGLLGLDEPLYPYWTDPDLKNDQRLKNLTPRLILSHQTGFPNWRYQQEDNKLTFEFDPGTQFQYSGEGFEYLRRALESKLGKSIEVLAKEFLFNPLAMNDTRFWWDDAMDESRYAKNFDEHGKIIATHKYYEANAAANLLTTAEDYGKFLAYLVNGAGLTNALFTEMQKPQVTVKDTNFFGLGWEILTGFSNDETLLLHSGKDPGVSTLAAFFPKSKNGYLIFLNGDNNQNILEELLTKYVYGGTELWNRK